MMRQDLVLAATLMLGLAGPAPAATFFFTASGTAGAFTSVDGSGAAVANPPGSIAAGDSVRASFRLHTDGMVADPAFAGDPTIALFTGRVTDFQLRVGGYAIDHAGPDFTTLQLWNDRPIGAGAADAVAISPLYQMPAAAAPFRLGDGPVDAIFGFNAYDFTGRVRHSLSPDEEPPLDAYGTRTAFVGFLDATTRRQTVFAIDGLSAALVAATVPEPATWTLLLAGFTLTGVGLRRRVAVPVG